MPILSANQGRTRREDVTECCAGSRGKCSPNSIYCFPLWLGPVKVCSATVEANTNTLLKADAHWDIVLFDILLNEWSCIFGAQFSFHLARQNVYM